MQSSRCRARQNRRRRRDFSHLAKGVGRPEPNAARMSEVLGPRQKESRRYYSILAVIHLGLFSIGWGLHEKIGGANVSALATGFWLMLTLGPPIFFLWEYNWLFKMYGHDPDSLKDGKTLLKEKQDLMSKIWAAAVAVLAMYLGTHK